MSRSSMMNHLHTGDNKNARTNGIADKMKPGTASETSICTYSIYSLQFFLLFPLARLSQQIGLPTLLGYIIALTGPPFLLTSVINALTKKNHTSITLVEHSSNSRDVNHPHSSATTVGVILYSIVLGLIFNSGLLFVTGHLESHFVPLGFYLLLLSSFHFSEYFVTSLTNPQTLTTSSFLIDQSSAYIVAISSSFVEYLLEAYFVPDFKKFNVISMFGLLVAIFGEVIRKSAMFTAGKNFSHFISVTKSPEHKLVTHGIYGLFRHPSYAGWFYWAVGSQIMLLNPICVILFTVISYKFFKDRIVYEEGLLIRFFKEDYVNYRKRVRVWMPISL